MKALARRLNDLWPWTTPADRALLRESWERRKAITRASRIRRRPEHVDNKDTWLHGHNADHCVCNGTHVSGFYCPRCPQPYWIANQVRFL